MITTNEEIFQMLTEVPQLTEPVKGSKTKIEEEQALYVRSGNPLEVFDRILQTEKLGWHWTLGTPEKHDIVDTFYDTPEGAIKSAKSSLRVRVQDGVTLVTMKGKNKGFNGSSTRNELEVEWPFQEVQPLDLVNLFGLGERQVRETTRIAIPILEKYKGEKIKIAELCLDGVVYKFSDTRQAKIYEIEIELERENAERVKTSLTQLVDALKNLCPELEKLKVSKYSLGKLLDATLKIRLDDNGVLVNEAYGILTALAE